MNKDDINSLPTYEQMLLDYNKYFIQCVKDCKHHEEHKEIIIRNLTLRRPEVK